MLEDTEQYFSDKEREGTQTSVTGKSKLDQQQMECIQEKGKRILEQQLAIDKQVTVIAKFQFCKI